MKGALRLASSAIEAAGMSRLIALHRGDCSQWQPKHTPTFVATNPPWGGRLMNEGDRRQQPQWRQQQQGGRDRDSGSGSRNRRGQEEFGWRGDDDEGDGFDQGRGAFSGGNGDGEELEDAWVSLQRFLKVRCPNAQAWVLSGAPELTRALGMRSFKQRSVSIGGVKTAWLAYDVLPPRVDRDDRDGEGG